MHSPSRFCTRCHQELTDAASMEFGVGPICRGLDNALLAKLYASDVATARTLFEAIDLALVAPMAVPTINGVYENLFADNAISRDDWRDDVKRIEWALSFPENNFLRPQLTSVVAALGYIGLAALWNGEAKTGKAFVILDAAAGRLVVQGARCKAANAAFRAIFGRKFHSEGTLSSIGVQKAAWSFPAKEHKAVFAAVSKHYPNNEGLKEACELAEASLALPAPVAAKTIAIDIETHTVAPVAAVPVAPKCSIAKVGVLLKVSTPYNPAYVNDLKTQVKWTDRKFNFAERCWELTLPYESKAKELVQKHFGESVVVVAS